MRTTLDIDDDVLSAARDIAQADGKSMGQVISDLARRALTAAPPGFAEPQAGFAVDEWPVFARHGGGPVTSDLIRQIEDEIAREDAVPFDHGKGAPRSFETTATARGKRERT